MVLTTGASVAGGIWDDNDPIGEWIEIGLAGYLRMIGIENKRVVPLRVGEASGLLRIWLEVKVFRFKVNHLRG
jgi:hypothetical protein